MLTTYDLKIGPEKKSWDYSFDLLTLEGKKMGTISANEIGTSSEWKATIGVFESFGQTQKEAIQNALDLYNLHLERSGKDPAELIFG